MQNLKNPLHDAVKEEKGCRLQEASHGWAKQNSQSNVCSLAELKQVKDWEKRPVEFKPFYKILFSENLGTHYCEWPAGKANAQVQMLVQANSKPHDNVIHRDGSFTRDQCGWGFMVKQGGRTVHKDSAAHRVTTSNVTMEVEAVTCNTVASLSAWHTDYTCHHSHRLNEPAAKAGVSNGLPRLAHSHAVFSCKDFCGSTAKGIPESVGMNGQIDWLAQQISHLVCSLAGQRCSEAWGTFWTLTGQSITALTAWRKEDWRKEAADIPPTGSGMICVQPDKHRHCFKGNLGETSERQGRVLMDL